MRDEYDFSEGRPNPYADLLDGSVNIDAEINCFPDKNVSNILTCPPLHHRKIGADEGDDAGEGVGGHF